VIVERIVAVVGDRPVLLSELRARARPNLIRVYGSPNRDPSFVAAAESAIYKEVLERIIDDRLEEQAAEKARIVVTPDEVSTSIENAAKRGGVRPSELVASVRRQGLTEQDFRDEIRRQILEGKLVEFRVRPRVRVTEQDARAAYQHWRVEAGEAVELRLLALRVQGDEATRMALANDVVARARAGEDFCALVEKHTDDVETRRTCGSRGPQPLNLVVPQLQPVVRALKAGEFSDPVRLRGGEAIVIVNLVREARVARFEDVRGEMLQRALLEGLEGQRKLWLQELRRGVYVDTRL
jgi:peptidyl-prolyl cis-trans isomerase SurA